MPRPPFPQQIDNTMRSAWKACQRKFWLSFMEGWAGQKPSVHLHAGLAFAKGLEVTRFAFYSGGASAEEAIMLGWKALIEAYGDFDSSESPNKNAHRMGEALVSYFDEYPLETDTLKPAIFRGNPAVEFTFAIPLPINHPETGLPILYCGRFDMLGEANGQLFVVDEKTTGSLGQYWARRYELSAQFTGYCWAAHQYGYPVVGAIVRGIGILKTDIKHAAMPLLRPPFMIEEWYRELLIDIHGMIEAWKKMETMDGWEAYRPDYADACGSYGGCQFISVCNIHPANREKLLAVNFTKREWTPLAMEGEDS